MGMDQIYDALLKKIEGGVMRSVLTSVLLLGYMACFAFINCSEKKDTYRHTKGTNTDRMTSSEIKLQTTKKRIFIDASFDSVFSINFEALDSILYRPLYCKLDEDTNIYIIDQGTSLIHKFSLSGDYSSFSHIVFGKGEGKGPGEFINPTDFKIYQQKIYIADPGTGSIEVYSTEGKHEKRIRLKEDLVPERITFLDDKIIIEPLGYSPGELFHVYSLTGSFIKKYGHYVDNTNIRLGVYHDNQLTEPIDNRYFYYLPYYLGFIGVFSEDSLLFAKATIDGIQKPEFVTKEIMKGVRATKLEERIETALRYAINENYILLQAYVYENKQFFHDFYDLENLSYICSTKEFPKHIAFAMKGDLLVCVYDLGLTVYDISGLNESIARFTLVQK